MCRVKGEVGVGGVQVQNKRQKRIPSKTIQQRIKERKWIDDGTVGVSAHGRGGKGQTTLI